MVPILLICVLTVTYVSTETSPESSRLEGVEQCEFFLDSPPKVYKWKPENPINMWELSGRFEGDLVGLPTQTILSRKGRCVMREDVDYWPNGVIPVDIKGFGRKDLRIIKKSLRIFEDNTCIRFPPRLKNHTSYLELRGDLGYGECWSYLGRVSGNQTLSLGEGCVDLHHSLHEIGHALGLAHQHSAPDRDDYINIHWENIDPDFVGWFDKFTWDEYTDLGLGYDYYSVMHYSAYIGSKNGKVTISAKDPNVTIEERTTLSEKDIKKLNIIYCSGKSFVRKKNYRTFGGYLVDLVDDFPPLFRHLIAAATALYLLVLTSLAGRWIFSSVLEMRNVPDQPHDPKTEIPPETKKEKEAQGGTV